MLHIYFGNVFIGSNLKFLRVQNGLTQQDIADLLNKNRANITYYENDRNFPPIDAVVELSRYFNVSIDDLVLKDLSKDVTKTYKSTQEADSDQEETTNELRVELVNAQRRIINFMDNEKKYEEARQISQEVINDLNSQVRLLQEKSNNLEKEIRELTERLKKINAR